MIGKKKRRMSWKKWLKTKPQSVLSVNVSMQRNIPSDEIWKTLDHIEFFLVKTRKRACVCVCVQCMHVVYMHVK